MEALSERIVAQLLTEKFPQLNHERIAPIAEGEGRTFLVDDTYIFRFPLDERGNEKMRREICLLKNVSLPLAVPHLEFVGQPSARLPFVFAGHRRIAGRSGEDARPERPIWPSIARQLGEFFSALHSVPVEVGERCGLAQETMQEPASLLQSTVKYADVIRSELPGIVDGRMEPFLVGDIALPPPSPPPVFVCNGDIKGEHIIMSERANAVAGIIDWTDCCLTDRILDFTGVMIWLGEAFLQQVLLHYTVPVDEAFPRRVCFYARCFSLGHLGQRLLGKTDSPLELLKTQTRWAFAAE